MNRRVAPHRLDLFEAVMYDIRLHGFRFIAVEFALATLGAVAISVVELLHAGHGGPPLLGAVWFLGVAVNCAAVVFLALQVRRTGTETHVSERRLHLYVLELVVLLLIPLAVAVSSLWQWSAGDFRSGNLPKAKEIS